jgi:hypothetical protein
VAAGIAASKMMPSLSSGGVEERRMASARAGLKITGDPNVVRRFVP